MTYINNKGDGKSSEEKFTWCDLQNYIEYKIVSNMETNEEYELYIDLVEYGTEAKSIHNRTYRKVLSEMQEEMGGEF